MTDTSSLSGKIAVVTGAAQGIGEATARLLAARGAAGLVLVDRNAELGSAVAASLQAAGSKAIFVHCELADPASVARVMPAADRAFGRVDILANVAGLTDRGSIWDTDVDLFDRMFAVNVRAPFFLIQDAIKLMQRDGIEGAIVNILSVNAYIGSPNLAAYSASKGALLTLTRNVAHALTGHRIRTNGIVLGWVDTPGEHVTLKTFHGAGDDWLQRAEAEQPTGKLLKPDDVARIVAFMACPESAPMTGTIMDYEQRVVGAGSGPDAYPRKE
jgi:NAD(P)-dependent dehydrogenase (short-subunit alcohol dehydrogenase family)